MDWARICAKRDGLIELFYDFMVYHLDTYVGSRTQMIPNDTSNLFIKDLILVSMGRARPKQKRSAPTSTAHSPSQSTHPPITSLLAKAQDLVIQCDYPLARKFIERVLSREDGAVSEKNQAKEMMGVVLLELGEVEAAKEVRVSVSDQSTYSPHHGRCSAPLFPRTRMHPLHHPHPRISTLPNSRMTTHKLP